MNFTFKVFILKAMIKLLGIVIRMIEIIYEMIENLQ